MTGLIVALAMLEHTFVTRNSSVHDIIYIFGLFIVLSLFIHSVHMLFKSDNVYDFDKFDFIGRIVICAIPFIVSMV